MTWLVTGGTGFLGVHLLWRLEERGIAARSLDLEPLDGAFVGVEPIVGDVRDERLVRRLLGGVDVLVHAAAALPSGGNLQAVNAGATGRLARLARQAGVQRSIFVSPGVVYGILPPPVSETATPSPCEPYGRSKLEAERAWLASALAPLVLRPSAFIGPERLGVFGILFRWIREGRRIYVLGDGANRYQLLDVDDLVRAVELAAERPGDGVANVGGRISGTIRADLEALILNAGSPSGVVGVPANPAKAVLAVLAAARISPLQKWHRLSADRDIVFDCSNTNELLGWRPARSGAEALIRSYDWYCAEGASRPEGIGHRSRWSEQALGVPWRVS